MPQLNSDILKDICKHLCQKEGIEDAIRFAVSGQEPMKAFMDLMATVKAVEFKIYGVKISFNWGEYIYNFNSEVYSNAIALKALRRTPELVIHMDELETRHVTLFQKWTEYDYLSKVTVYRDGDESEFLVDFMTTILQMPIKNFVTASSALIPFISSTNQEHEYESTEIQFENGYFDRLETILSSYRFRSKNLTLSFTGEYTWYEILYVVSKVVKENNKGNVSTLVENLRLCFNGDIDVPALTELQLTEFFEDIYKCFPNLKNVYFCLDFTNNAEGLLTEEDASIELYSSTFSEVIKQVSKASIDYNLIVEWLREDHMIDISPENSHFTALCEALTNDLGFQPIENKEFCWKTEKKISENKLFKMTITLVQPSFQDLDFYEELLHDAGIMMPDDYDAYDHDFEGEDYDGQDYYDYDGEGYDPQYYDYEGEGYDPQDYDDDADERYEDMM